MNIGRRVVYGHDNRSIYIFGVAPYAIGPFWTNTGGAGGFDLKDEGEDWPNPYYYKMDTNGRPPENLLGLTIQLKKDYGATT